MPTIPPGQPPSPTGSADASGSPPVDDPGSPSTPDTAGTTDVAPDVFDAGPTQTAAPRVRDEAHVRGLIDELVRDSFPELAGKPIDLAFFQSDAYFFRSRPNVGSVLNPFASTRFCIDVNRKIFNLDLPEDAARAILAHELSHTLSYVNHGVGGMISALWGEVSQGHQVGVERETDLVAMKRGYADGLKAYRNWIYPQLDAADLAEKRAVYLTPEEIDLIKSAAASAPGVYDRLMADPPTDLADTRAKLAAA